MAGREHRSRHTSTPNILAISHRLPETRDQYLSSSFCAPSTLSTTSSLLTKRVSRLLSGLEGWGASPAGHTCWRRCAGSSRTVRSPCRRAAQSCGTCRLAMDLGERECRRAYIDPSSLMVDSMASMACPRWWMYVFWPSSIIWSCSCWSPPIGLSEMRSVAGAGVPLLGVP